MLAPNIIVKAGAGSGKTWTVTEGVHKMYHARRPITPSPEQQAVHEAMLLDEYPGRIHMTSFTTDAAAQLEEKCPFDASGGRAATSSSTYGMGLRFAKERGEAWQIDKWGNKYKSLVTDFLGKTKYESDKLQPGVWEAIFEIQGKSRLDLKKSVTEEETRAYADHFGVDLRSTDVEQVTEGINEVLDAGRRKTQVYDFTDMVYQPVVRGMLRQRYETLVVDEFQDMGRAQQELCLGVSWRRILIGDPHQAIYGFAGADQSAFDRIETYLGRTQRGVQILPLNESRRCAKAIVRRANQVVEELRPLANAPEGDVFRVSKSEFHSRFMDNLVKTYSNAGTITNDTMIICPTNAPLIGLMFKLQKKGVRSFVHGKDITASMQNFVSKCDKGIGDLRIQIGKKLEEWGSRKPSKTRDLQLDIYGALDSIASECSTVTAVIDAIKNVFSDVPRPGWLKLSSIHKAKGLEASTIIIWEVDNCRSKWSTLPWQHLQDKNLEYVAITRAKTCLIEVTSR